MMKLYTVPLAPNPMRVSLYLAERRALGAQIDVDTVIINTLKGEQRGSAHLARNRWGTLPVLELASGECITESLSIIDYFEQSFSAHRLLPEDPLANALARNLERTVEMRITFDLGWYVHFTRSPLPVEPNPEKAAELASRIQPGFDYIETLLSDGRPFLGGDRVGTADVTLAAFLQFMRYTKTDLLGERPALRRWDTAYRSRDAVADLFMM